MEVAWTVPFLLLVGGCFSLPPPPEPICPERCDCQHQQHLLCTNRGLRAVPKTSALPSPQEVLTYSLGGNFIANITAFDFHRLAQLRRLDLQFNQIRSLHPKTFEKLSRLEELYLGNNLLEGLAPGTLAPLAKLRILYVNGNEIGRLNRGSFEGLESLVKLRLDGNSLGSLPDSAFAPLGNLLYLHLEANRIRFLGKNAFAHLGKLRFLNLSGNELQPSLRHPATFGPLRSLSTLVLSANSLQQLGGRVFQHLPRLGLLSLSGNQLAHLAPEAFAGLSALRELRLEGNRLRELPAALLDPLGSLETLDLSRNELSALHPAAFRHLSRLRELNLRDNELGSLAGDIFTASPALYSLDLDGNGWTCDCRLRGLKRWMGHWHSQGRLLTVFVQCRHPPALRGKYLDYLDDVQLENGSCLHPASSSSPASVLPAVSTAAGAGEEPRAPPLGDLGKPQPQPQQQQQQQRRLAHPGVTWDEGAGAHSSNQSGLRLSRRGPGLQHPSPSSATTLQLSPPVDLVEKPEGTSPSWEDNGPSQSTPSFQSDAPSSSAPSPASDSGQRAEMQRLAAKHQERAAPSVAQEMPPPLVSDPCDFNKFILCNLTVEAVGTDTATVRWAVREHRSPWPLDGARFRLLFDRFGQQPKFHRFVYLPERSDTATLRELRSDTPYLVCVEAVLGGRVCPVAPRDHCAGLVTLPEAGHVGTRAGGVDYQLLTLVLLAVNALLVFLALAAWASRWLRRKLRGRRKGGAPVHVRQMYSTRRPLRSMGTGVSADFSGFQSHRPRTAVCALSEADLIEFPCDRFMDSGGGSGGSRREDHLMQRFAD
ncbi:TLR4 interactor with leucine rich repeats-like [Vombatus ursinus]|uniref:TLR4 interactor with leucine rich repeats n=1 Tax=Vombatus ursinus TaxID=29139 RepID=A0A4X2LV86_VOMUR|nr:TLR4 interactor with leucine rich repeats-like [Vombatus ursinus]XP_027727795.1 TLR4 interactor with leucine rich repeats-like [Vombatus ursinus]